MRVFFSSRLSNLIKNFRFESGIGKKAANWIVIVPEDAKVGEMDEKESHSGKKSFKISRIWNYPQKTIKVKTKNPVLINPNKKIHSKFLVKTKDITEYSLPFSANYLMDSEISSTLVFQKLIFNSDSRHQYYILLDNLPVGSKILTLSFNSSISTKGSIWFEDILFAEASEEDVNNFEEWRRQTSPQIIGQSEKRNLIKQDFTGSNKQMTTGGYEFGKDSLERPLDWSWPQVLRNQKERGEAYEMTMKQFASLEFVIGAGWFITFDMDSESRRANRGLMNFKFELCKDLKDTMKRTNEDIKNQMKNAW